MKELLKKIYVDSALRREKKLDEKDSSTNIKKKTVKEKNISYTEYKKLIDNCNREKNNN